MQQPPQPPQLAQSQSQPQQLSVGAIAATPPPPTQSQQQPDTSKSTLWMGDLEPWMDENYIKQLWFSLGENVTVKMIRDKNTGTSAGYCFVDFGTHASALKQLANVQGYVIPGTNRIFKLNWASGGGLVDRKDAGPEFSLFVGDLGQEVNDQLLMATFQTHYESCKAAKVVTDPMTGMSRGYGFVRFSTELDQQRAMTEMQGQFCGSRPMRISTATPKNRSGIATIGMVGGLNSTLPGGQVGSAVSLGSHHQMTAAAAGYYGVPLQHGVNGSNSNTGTGGGSGPGNGLLPNGSSGLGMGMGMGMGAGMGMGMGMGTGMGMGMNMGMGMGMGGLGGGNVGLGGGGGLGPMGGTAGQQYNPYADPNNTTVFIGGLSPSVGDDELRSHFSQFGEIVYTKIPPGKGCGFVQYSHRHSAEIAIQQMNNALIGGSRVRLSWGKSQAALKGPTSYGRNSNFDSLPPSPMPQPHLSHSPMIDPTTAPSPYPAQQQHPYAPPTASFVPLHGGNPLLSTPAEFAQSLDGGVPATAAGGAFEDAEGTGWRTSANGGGAEGL